MTFTLSLLVGYAITWRLYSASKISRIEPLPSDGGAPPPEIEEPARRAFRAAFRRRRCLVLADGFYEWQKREKGAKQPYRITLADGGPFGFAGLWESWRDPESGDRIESATIIVTEANDLLRPIHDRMPVILAPADFDVWLDTERPGEAAQALLRPYPAAALATYPVSTRVNKVTNDDPAVIAPLEEAEEDAPREGQGRLL